MAVVKCHAAHVRRCRSITSLPPNAQTPPVYPYSKIEHGLSSLNGVIIPLCNNTRHYYIALSKHDGCTRGQCITTLSTNKPCFTIDFSITVLSEINRQAN